MKRPIQLLAPLAFLLLGACAALSGKHGSFAVYAPRLQALPAATGPAPIDWQLLVETPRASAALDTTHIAVMPRPGVIEVYADARWRDPAPDMLRSLIVQAFDQDHRVLGVSAGDSGLNGDFSLTTELHDFQIAMTDGSPQATIRLTAKLFDRRSNRIVASQAFSEQVPAADSGVDSAVAAFEQALDRLLPALVEWTVAAGQEHRQVGTAAKDS